MPSSGDISTSTKASTTEEMRLRNYRTQLENEHELQVRDLEAHNHDEIERLMERHKMQMDQLRGAYDVQISEEAEQLEQRLRDVRLEGEERIVDQKKIDDDAALKERVAGQKRIEEYRKNAEAQLEKTRRDLQINSENLHDKARKTARKEREVSEA